MATRKQPVLPLLDIQSPAFVEQYERGVWWSMHGEGQGTGPFSIRSFKATLEMYCAHRSCEQQDPSWRYNIGFFIGMYHGGVLSAQTGLLHPGVSALIVLDSPDTSRGYRVGREAFFHEVEPHYRYTEHTLTEYLHELVMDAPCWKEPEGTWDYTLGCLLGELSGFLFPETHGKKHVVHGRPSRNRKRERDSGTLSCKRHKGEEYWLREGDIPLPFPSQGTT
jgi:hypothetical protein